MWIDRQLQKVVIQQRSYLKNALELKQQISQLELPSNALLFTADAVSMYTSIPTQHALRIISAYLFRHRRRHPTLPLTAVTSALRLVMTYNIFQFGDTTFRQLNGTAMGTSPAPAYATLYYAIEEEHFLDLFQDYLLFYRRYIDDVFGIIIPPENETEANTQWNRLQQAMNNSKGLVWEFSKPSHTVDFLDLTISYRDRVISTTLYEKPLNLHLYIPPSSAHPPGLLNGIVFGTIHRIYTLCSSSADIKCRTTTFFQRLQARGYKKQQLLPIFHKAITRANKDWSTDTPLPSTKPKHVIFHLRYHPQDPPSSAIQQLWNKHVANPKYKMPLVDIPNPKTKLRPRIQRLIIAYSRPMNLGNLLSHRHLNANGPPASSYYHPD